LPRRPWGDISNTESQLESGIAFNEQLSKFSGRAVLAGLGIEIVLASAYHAHASFVENWGPVFATALIALGVFGEIHFAGKVSKSEERLRQISDEKVAEATDNAAKAHERAAVLEKEAAEARERTAEIERLTMPRRISWEQRDKVADAIRRKPPDRIFIRYHLFDIEATVFALELFKLFMEAEANPSDSQGHFDLNDRSLTFGMFVHSEPEIFASLLLEAFRNAKIPAAKGSIRTRLFPDRSGSETVMYIYVGHKPLIES